jgi:hypothetical protein
MHAGVIRGIVGDQGRQRCDRTEHRRIEFPESQGTGRAELERSAVVFPCQVKPAAVAGLRLLVDGATNRTLLLEI